ncbi:MAG: porin family protein [Paludibacteraceae bacterium]
MNREEIKRIVPKIVVVLVFFCTHQTLFPQTVLLDPPEHYIGTSHGVNASTVLFNPSVTQNFMFLGYTGGICYRYVTEKRVGLQLELKYSQRGWEEASGKYTRRIDYIELPMLTHIYLFDKHRVIFNLGPKVSYVLSDTKLKNTVPDLTVEQQKDVYYPFDYGLTAGIGYNLHTRKTGVYELEFRCYYGLSDIFANTKSDYFVTSNYLNFSLNLGWYFQLSGKK